ncbi:histidine decarboxylase [Actinopolyspora biskrensis]|uniref:Histidine decarboxylase n=1 Tax=Actinopolyspora biskrensis TaxID=1470178 RepID=A0A852YUQ0_9ACTN|nr:pyridoxal-dependent decarboxylase [Actinopolyspora biskrensis]NYH77708.1 histidine decarboxylase [Actinopolyspora biskrensis]
MSDLSGALKARARYMLGFQTNQDLPRSRVLHEFLGVHANNAGDPFVEGDYGINTKPVERAVLDYFARLWSADSYWGYVLTLGGSEGTIQALWSARERLGASSSGPEPVLFYSEAAHYSLPKVAGMLKLSTFAESGRRDYPGECPLPWSGDDAEVGWPDAVPVGPDSAVDVDALVRLVGFFVERGHPVILVFNYGATATGAYDDVAAACRALRPSLSGSTTSVGENGGAGYWVHVDGAFGAGFMPYVETGYRQGRSERCGPLFDFRVEEVTSIVCSGHKYLGAPWPCGVYLTRNGGSGASEPTIVGSPDSTLGGSRNALAPVFLWYALARASEEERVTSALRCLEVADYAERRLRELDEEMLLRDGRGLEVTRPPVSLSVQFRRPGGGVMDRYALPGFADTGVSERRRTHLYVLPHVTEGLIDELVEDLRARGSSAGTE